MKFVRPTQHNREWPVCQPTPRLLPFFEKKGSKKALCKAPLCFLARNLVFLRERRSASLPLFFDYKKTRSVLSSDGKNQRSPGDGFGEHLRGAGAHRRLSPGPLFYGGRLPESWAIASGGQNLSGLLFLPPGHWALGLQKLPLVRFHDCAWVCRANGTRSVDGGGPPGGGPAAPAPPMKGEQ